MFPDDNFVQPAFFMVVTLGLGRVCIKESISPSHGRLLLVLQPVVFFVLIFIVWLIAPLPAVRQADGSPSEEAISYPCLVARHRLLLPLSHVYRVGVFDLRSCRQSLGLVNGWLGPMFSRRSHSIRSSIASLLCVYSGPPPFLCGLRCVQFLPRFKELMDEATDIYEDNHRWYVSVNLLRRLGIVLLGALAAFVNVSVKMLLMAVYLVLLLVLHSIIRSVMKTCYYKNYAHNVHTPV